MEKLKINISMLLVGVKGHLKIGHTLGTSYNHIANLKRIHHVIFEMLPGEEV